MLSKYLLNDGTIHWNNLYLDLVPDWMTKYSPPCGFYNYAHYAISPLEYVKDVCLQAKWFVQRGRRGWSDSDAWGWYTHHARVTVGVLKHLRKNKHGHPIGLTSRSWAAKLTVMIDGFQAVIEEENDFTSYKRLTRKAHLKLIAQRQKRLTVAMDCFKVYYQDLWD